MGIPLYRWMDDLFPGQSVKKKITGASPMTKRKPPPVLKLPTSPKRKLTGWSSQRNIYIEGENQTRNANINSDFDFWDKVGLQPIYNVCFCGNS